MTGTRAIIKISAMSPDLEQDCVSCAAYALKEKNLVEQRSIAQFIKRELDRKYGFVWHVIVGRSFGSYVAHDEQNFCYFFIGDCAFLIWRTESKPSKIVDVAALRATRQKSSSNNDADDVHGNAEDEDVVEGHAVAAVEHDSYEKDGYSNGEEQYPETTNIGSGALDNGDVPLPSATATAEDAAPPADDDNTNNEDAYAMEGNPDDDEAEGEGELEADTEMEGGGEDDTTQ